MDISHVYALVMGGSFCLLLLINGLPLIARLIRYLSPLVLKHPIYRYILRRRRLLGPWSRADVLVQLIYIVGNICCFEFFQPKSVLLIDNTSLHHMERISQMCYYAGVKLVYLPRLRLRGNSELFKFTEIDCHATLNIHTALNVLDLVTNKVSLS